MERCCATSRAAISPVSVPRSRGLLRQLGVTVIWMTPFVEQIHAGVDEGTGKTYGYHGEDP